MNSKYYNSSYCNDPCYPQHSKPQPQPQPCAPCDSSYVIGNNIDFKVDKCDSEIKANLTVGYRDTIRVWGQITDCTGKPVQYAYLKLIKLVGNGYVGVAHTVSDCLGFYQFDICPCPDGTKYRILVSKASEDGSEKVITKGNCDPCSPCAPQCDCR